MEPENVEYPEKKNSLGAALGRSIALASTTDLLADLSDITLDKAIESGALDNVPIFGAVVKLIKTGGDVRDMLYIRKVARFLNEMATVSEVNRQRFVQTLEKRGALQEFGETVLLLLDRAEDMKKPQIIGRVMRACIEEKIDLDKAMRLAAIVNRCYAQDLNYLKRFREGTQGEMTPIAESLFAAGVLSNGGIDGGEMNTSEGGTLYYLNEYGNLLVRHGL